MRTALLDSNVYIDFWERKLHAHTLATIHAAFVVRFSAVVLSELRSRTCVGRRSRIWRPTAGDWWEAGKLVRDVGDQQTWDTNKRRESQNDALLALTARSTGALLVTSNRADFEQLERRLGMKVQYV